MRTVLLIVVLLPAAALAQKPSGLADLTVPGERLSTGCRLSPTPSVKLEGNRVRGGLWAGLPGNPWIGSDAAQVARIASVFNPPARMSDGPPLNSHDAALFRLRLADGIEDGYEAVYVSGDTTVMNIVYGLRFPTPAAARLFFQQSRFALDPNAVQAGSVVALLAGPAGDCHDAVLGHLKSLAQ